MQFFRFWWEAVCESFGFGWIVIGAVSTAMPLVITLILKYLPQSQNVAWITWVSDHQAELHMMMATVCIAAYLFVAPFRMYQRERIEKEAAQSALKAQPVVRFPIDVADTEGRAQLAIAESKLAKAEAKIKEFDPLLQPIASAIATATIDVVSDKPEGNIFGIGGWVGIGRGNEELLLGGINSTQALPAPSGIGRYRIVCPVDADSPYLGKPIKRLLDAGYIQCGMNLKYLPPKGKVAGGHIVWVINNAVTLKFIVPPQISDEEGRIRVVDLSEGLRPLRN